MISYTVNVHSHKTLKIVATVNVQGWDVIDANHAAIRLVLAQSNTWEQHGGLFARVVI